MIHSFHCDHIDDALLLEKRKIYTRSYEKKLDEICTGEIHALICKNVQG